MEMHIIHRNAAYPNLSHALNYQDGISVLGIFFQVRRIYLYYFVYSENDHILSQDYI